MKELFSLAANQKFRPATEIDRAIALERLVLTVVHLLRRISIPSEFSPELADVHQALEFAKRIQPY